MNTEDRIATLMDSLPAFIRIPGQEPFDCYNLMIKKCSTRHIQYIVNYYCDTMSPDWPHPRLLWPNNIFGENLADCLAEALLRIEEIKKVVADDS